MLILYMRTAGANAGRKDGSCELDLLAHTVSALFRNSSALAPAPECMVAGLERIRHCFII